MAPILLFYDISYIFPTFKNEAPKTMHKTNIFLYMISSEQIIS